jgi:hypothetical protein
MEGYRPERIVRRSLRLTCTRGPSLRWSLTSIPSRRPTQNPTRLGIRSSRLGRTAGRWTSQPPRLQQIRGRHSEMTPFFGLAK